MIDFEIKDGKPNADANPKVTLWLESTTRGDILIKASYGGQQNSLIRFYADGSYSTFRLSEDFPQIFQTDEHGAIKQVGL